MRTEKDKIREREYKRKRRLDPTFIEKERQYYSKYWANLSLEQRCKAALRTANRYAKIRGHTPCLADWSELAATLENQDYRCAITGISESLLGKKLHMDHDHKTGKFRGWIAPRANQLL